MIYTGLVHSPHEPHPQTANNSWEHTLSLLEFPCLYCHAVLVVYSVICDREEFGQDDPEQQMG